MNVYTKQKHSHWYRKQSCGYQREKEHREEKFRGMGLTNYYSIYIKIDKQ